MYLAELFQWRERFFSMKLLIFWPLQCHKKHAAFREPAEEAWFDLVTIGIVFHPFRICSVAGYEALAFIKPWNFIIR
jgi:hypothetical protein